MQLPKKPDPDILIWFDTPRSQTEVRKLSGVWHSTIFKHMRVARRMGLIHGVGTRPVELRGPRHTLYELTLAGVDYLEANNGE